MINMPYISGFALTDTERNIVDADGKPVFLKMPSHLRSLDQSLLRQWAKGGRVVVVIGENTFKDIKHAALKDIKHTSLMKTLTSSSQDKPLFLVSGKDYYKLGEYKDMSDCGAWDKRCDSKEQLASFAVRVAVEHSRSILVLGGRSVYEAFSGLYDSFHLATYNGYSEGQKSISSVVSSFRDYDSEEVFCLGDYHLTRYSKGIGALI